LKGQLTTAEIRKLVRAHNKLSKITIPPKSSRDEILTIISKAGFRVNHEKQLLEQLKKMDISLEKAKDATKPVKKTEEQKQQAKAKKEAKVKEQKTKEAELINKGAVIGKLVAKKQMSKEQKKKVESKSDTKKQPKKLKKDLQQDIQGGIELEQIDTPMSKNRCKDWIYVSKKMIQADKDNFKKVRLFDKDVSNDVDSFGRRFKTPTPLLKIYDFVSMFESKLTADRIRKLCGVQEATFAETAYDILYNKWDQIKDVIVKQNIKKNPDIESKLKKPKQIDYQYYEPKKDVKKDLSTDDTEKFKKEVPYIISKIKDNNAKLYDYNFMKEKDIVEWFNNWKRDRRTLIRELKVALSKGVVTKEDLKPVEPININRTKEYKIREAQIFRAIKEQEQKN
jgi:hypothetical protein